DSGGGGQLELAKRANRGGGGAGRGASWSLAGNSCCEKKRAEMFKRPSNACGALRPAPPPPPLRAQPTVRVGVLYVKNGGQGPPMPPPPLSRWRMPQPRSDERQRLFDLDFSPIAFSLVLLHTGVLAIAAGTIGA